MDDEPDADRAAELLEMFDAGALTLVAPDCFYYELGNLARTAERRNRVTRDRADAIFTAIAGATIRVVSTQELLQAAVTLSRSNDVSIYDALYLALAELLGATFVTADDALLRRVQHLTYVRELASS